MGALLNVTTAAQDALAYGERQGWTIENRSDVPISFCFDGSVGTNSAGTNPGITLDPGEKWTSTSGMRDASTPWNRVSVIHNSSGNKPLFIHNW